MHEEAIQNYDKAIELNPIYFRSYLNKGISLRALKRNHESIISFQKSIELKPNVDAYFHEANIYYEVIQNKKLSTFKTLKPNYFTRSIFIKMRLGAIR